MELKKTPLYEEHKKLNAKLTDFAGFSMPLQYSSVKEESLSVREKVGMFDVSHMGEFFVTGPEAQKFVEYLLPNKIIKKKDHTAIYSPLLNEDGKIIDDLIVYNLSPDEIMICVNAANIDKDYAHIKEYIKSFDCKLEDRSSVYSLIAVQGPQSSDILVKLGLLEGKEELGSFQLKMIPIGGQENTIIAHTGYTGEDGYEIFISNQKVEQLWTLLLEHKVTPCGLAARDVLRIEAGYPLYGQELSEELTPFDCGLKWTVKMDKGEFLGKKALEQYVPKYRPIKILLEKGIPRSGYNVTDINGTIIGIISSGTHSPLLGKGIALARIKNELYPSDKKFFVDIRGKQIEGTNKKKFLNKD